MLYASLNLEHLFKSGNWVCLHSCNVFKMSVSDKLKLKFPDCVSNQTGCKTLTGTVERAWFTVCAALTEIKFISRNKAAHSGSND